MNRTPVAEGIVAALLIFSVSCSSNSQETATFKILDECLQQANKTIQNQNSAIYAAIEERLKEYRHEAKAKVWYPRAMTIMQHSDVLRRYIDDLKLQVKKEAGVRWNNGIELFHEQDESVVDALFIDKGKGIELFARLKQYKKLVLAVDSNMQRHLQGRILFTSTTDPNIEQNEEAFINAFFRGKTPVAALTMLSRLQNAVVITENRLASYCLDHSTTLFCGFSTFAAIVGQSSSYVKAGEEMTIQAGVGAFSTESRPQITMNGKSVHLNPEGVAVYKWKAPRKPGLYKVPTIIKYIDQDGNLQTITKDVTYTVANTSSQ